MWKLHSKVHRNNMCTWIFSHFPAPEIRVLSSVSYCSPSIYPQPFWFLSKSDYLDNCYLVPLIQTILCAFEVARVGSMLFHSLDYSIECSYHNNDELAIISFSIFNCYCYEFLKFLNIFLEVLIYLDI